MRFTFPSPAYITPHITVPTHHSRSRKIHCSSVTRKTQCTRNVRLREKSVFCSSVANCVCGCYMCQRVVVRLHAVSPIFQRNFRRSRTRLDQLVSTTHNIQPCEYQHHITIFAWPVCCARVVLHESVADMKRPRCLLFSC